MWAGIFQFLIPAENPMVKIFAECMSFQILPSFISYCLLPDCGEGCRHGDPESGGVITPP
jgi:hypothetical protein